MKRTMEVKRRRRVVHMTVVNYGETSSLADGSKLSVWGRVLPRCKEFGAIAESGVELSGDDDRNH
jgi:hypothetical protein